MYYGSTAYIQLYAYRPYLREVAGAWGWDRTRDWERVLRLFRAQYFRRMQQALRQPTTNKPPAMRSQFSSAIDSEVLRLKHALAAVRIAAP